jgi:peptidoglycan hydrolase-like protein with peptidoglycan-binding domain
MQKPKNRTVKTLVTSTAFASMILTAPVISHAQLGDQTLKQGMQNPDVKQLQDLLKAKGTFNFSQSTGYFGTITKEAVADFQRKHGLVPDGIVGEKTFQALGVGDVKKSSNESSTNRLLRIGSRGQAVTDLQSKLQDLGYDSGKIDGIYGSMTASAVRQFQRTNHLQVDGIAGPETLSSLYGQAPQKALSETPAKSKTTGNTAKLLKAGSRGEAVSDVQRKLKAAGLYTYEIDGIYGSLTTSAVKAFQRNHNLEVDGIVGPKTLAALNSSPSEGSSTKTSAASSNSGNGLLQFRDRGSDVTDLQKKLKKVGVFNQSPTGYFGVDTEAAVRKFQSQHGLFVDGIVGPNTRAKLAQVLAGNDDHSTAVAGASFSVTNLVADAVEYIGVPYVWGGTTPAGFDCSGFVQYVFKLNGIDLPRTVASMWYSSQGKKVSRSNLRPGDVVFFQGTYKSGPSHNGIYTGNGKFIQSGTSTGVVDTELSNPYWSAHYLGAKRY